MIKSEYNRFQSSAQNVKPTYRDLTSMFFRNEPVFWILQTKRVAALTIFCWILSASPIGACPESLPFGSVEIKGHRLDVEIASTPSARACGLSHRQSLPENQGMVFVFPVARPVSFWMKDTQIPLTIAFLDTEGRILSIQAMQPHPSEKRYHSPVPVRYVLEVNQGWFKVHGIDVGDIVKLEIPLGINIH